jgi:hypothetical protein
MSIYHVSIGLTSQGRYLILTGSYEVFVCLMVFNATFNNIFNYIVAVSFIGGGNRSIRRKQPTCCKLLYHIMLYTSPWSRFELTKSVVIGTDCIGSCKSNYLTITAVKWKYKSDVHSDKILSKISWHQFYS